MTKSYFLDDNNTFKEDEFIIFMVAKRASSKKNYFHSYPIKGNKAPCIARNYIIERRFK